MRTTRILGLGAKSGAAPEHRRSSSSSQKNAPARAASEVSCMSEHRGPPLRHGLVELQLYPYRREFECGQECQCLGARREPYAYTPEQVVAKRSERMSARVKGGGRGTSALCPDQFQTRGESLGIWLGQSPRFLLRASSAALSSGALRRGSARAYPLVTCKFVDTFLALTSEIAAVHWSGPHRPDRRP